MLIQTIQILGIIILFVGVFVVFYNPVMKMLGKRQKYGSESTDITRNRNSEGNPVASKSGGIKNKLVATKTSWYLDPFLLPTILLVVLADQLSKFIVKTNLHLYESWPQEGIFRITHGLNTGTAFGLFPNQTLVLIIASLIAIGFLYYLYRTQVSTNNLRLAIGMQLGGAIGNLTDRIRTGYVVDFIDVGWWPIFNLADSSIVIGMVLLLATTIFGKGFQRNNTGSVTKNGEEK